MQTEVCQLYSNRFIKHSASVKNTVFSRSTNSIKNLRYWSSQTLLSFKNVDSYRYYNLLTVNKKLALMRPTKTENLTSISSILCNIDSRLWVSATGSVWSLSCWSMLHSSWAVSSKRSSNSFSLRISAFVAACYLKKTTNPKISATGKKKQPKPKEK